MGMLCEHLISKIVIFKAEEVVVMCETFAIKINASKTVYDIIGDKPFAVGPASKAKVT